MAARPQDWFRQAERDLTHARNSLQSSEFEWACFASHQAAEKAVKAVFQHRGAEGWGHAVSALLQSLKDLLPEPEASNLDRATIDLARELDKHYIPTRYPDALPEGAPYEFYTQAEAERAIAHAEQLLRICAGLLA